ncbi:alanine/ornithine racemase family PLP-dependent enzyme, partial [Cutibacterium acnes]
VVELERKPSIPQGERGQDAFGQTVKFVDRGVRLRAICDLGRQDVAPEDLTPVDPGHIVLGASSDHLIIDVTDGDTTLRVGSEIRLRPTYGGLLTASTCADVWKTSADER